MRACVEPEALRALFAAMEEWDISALLPRIKAPTLVVQNRENRYAPVQNTSRLAAQIPNARFVVVDDIVHEGLAGLIEDFVGPRRLRPNSPPAPPSSSSPTSSTPPPSPSASATPPSARRRASWTRAASGHPRERRHAHRRQAPRRRRARRLHVGAGRRSRRRSACGRRGRRRRACRCTSASTPATSSARTNNVYGGAVNIAARDQRRCRRRARCWCRTRCARWRGRRRA